MVILEASWNVLFGQQICASLVSWATTFSNHSSYFAKLIIHSWQEKWLSSYRRTKQKPIFNLSLPQVGKSDQTFKYCWPQLQQLHSKKKKQNKTIQNFFRLFQNIVPRQLKLACYCCIRIWIKIDKKEAIYFKCIFFLLIEGFIRSNSLTLIGVLIKENSTNWICQV